MNFPGYATKGDRSEWAEFRHHAQGFRNSFIKYQERLYKEFNYEPRPIDYPPTFSYFPQSEYGWIYGYPKEIDYDDVLKISDKYIRVDAFCRETPEPFQLPEGFHKEGEKLIYFSLGSMGSVDTDLVQRVAGILSKVK